MSSCVATRWKPRVGLKFFSALIFLVTMAQKLVLEMNCSEFAEFLTDKGFHEEIVSSFSSNRVNGANFFDLTDEDLKEMLPVVGDRAHIRRLMRDLKEVNEIRIRISSY